MSELVLKSMYDPDNCRITFDPLRNHGITIRATGPASYTGLTISHVDARQLRDFLNKELGEQAPKPMGTGRWVYLETNMVDGNVWEQFPTLDRAKEYASKRTGFSLKSQAVALLHQQLVPVVTTSYEWKDIS